MGTEIALSIGGVDISWSKNHSGIDHGSLFQEQDRKAVHCDQLDYDYHRNEGLDPRPKEMAFARKLAEMVPRLELLGFTLARARAEYDDRVKSWREEQVELGGGETPSDGEPLSCDEFLTLANRYALAELDDKYIDDDKNTDSAMGRFKPEEGFFARIPSDDNLDAIAYSERSYFGGAINILHPYSMLRVLAENAVNGETDVIWQYGPLVENGWASASEFNGDARRSETFLIATEGSSDAHILRHALSLLRPEILDFFRFIDVSDRHPFSGTGNLVKFAEGLAKIDVHNQTVFLFDNDAEGVEAYGKVGALKLPPNMRAMLLPDLESFRCFPTKGPNGDEYADINGRGAAIECYLDHQVHDYPPPRVVWTNYKREMDLYHGALEHKESYAKAFLALRREALAGSSYDVDKINRVLEALVAECISISQPNMAARVGLATE